MKWLSKKKEKDEASYWQTIADILSALFLLILLISLLLILYILRIPETTEPDPDPGNYHYETDSLPGDHEYDSAGNHYSAGGYGYRYERGIEWSGSGNGGGGGGNGHDGEGDYRYEEPGWGDYDGTEKAAVYVRVLDAETGKVIREKDIDFTLFYPGGKQELLTVYYPQKITYKDYATTEQGTFYLPDKVRLGEHRLKELTEPYGYDAADDVTFLIEESHEWDEPYILDVPLYPSRNVIRVLQTDTGTGDPLVGGLYRITAAEDIITADGTLRYHAGDELSRITCDENGLAVSQELYLGEYTVTQILPPEYYAASSEPVTAVVGKKQEGKLPEPCLFECSRTMFSLVVADELYESERIAGAQFSFRKDGEPLKQTLTTDRNGMICLTELTPETTYTLRQESTAGDYTNPGTEISFTVDEQGLIGGDAEHSIQITNRMLRTSVLIRDAVLRKPISDKGVSLFNMNGDCIAQWTSSGNPHELNGLEPGDYRITMAGAAKEMMITVTDQAEIQTFEFNIITNGSLIGLSIAGAVLIGAGVFTVIHVTRKRGKKQTVRR